MIKVIRNKKRSEEYITLNNGDIIIIDDTFINMVISTNVADENGKTRTKCSIMNLDSQTLRCDGIDRKITIRELNRLIAKNSNTNIDIIKKDDYTLIIDEVNV